MQRSDRRILTTHVGSLPRQRELSDLLIAQEAGQSVDEKRLDELADAGVKAQVDSEVDIINDGEQPRVIEHPQVICKRILEAVDAVGDKQRVIAGGDCGFGTFAGWEMVAPAVVWAKFAALAEGARLASQKLW